MLHVKCQQCNEITKSPLLVEMRVINCSRCKTLIPPDDIIVSTESFTMHYRTLLRRVASYRAILKDFEREINALAAEASAESKRKVLEQYYNAMQELMVYARSNYRLPISDNWVTSIKAEEIKINAELKNISTSGAAITCKGETNLPKRGTEFLLFLELPQQKKALSLKSRIAWSKRPKTIKNHAMVGVSFVSIEETDRSQIWSYIYRTYNQRQGF